MLRSMPAMWSRDPRFELELVLRLEVFVFAGAAEDQQHQDRDREVDAEPDEDLGFGAEAAALLGGRLLDGDGRSALTRGLPFARLEEVGEPWAAKETVKRTSSSRAAARPSSRSARPTSRTAVAISQTRPRVVAATIPIARWRLPAASSAAARRPASNWIPRCASQAAARDGVAEQRQSAKQENRQRGGQHQRSTYLGGDIKSALPRGERADERLYPKGPIIGFLKPDS